MTVYDARPGRRLRPTVRLRLTLVNGVLLVGAAMLLLLLAWLLVGQALRPAQQLSAGTRVVLADGRPLDAREWERQLVDNAEGELLTGGIAAVLVISVLGVAGAYLVAGRALRPLHRVTATARRLSGETLDQRIRYDGADDEVAELAATFDAMLDRLNESFDSQKRFVANASHELRTPLAVMRTEIDVTRSDPAADVAEYRRMATVVRDASERANALVEALLVLARTDAQAGRRLVRKIPADLSGCATAALSAMDREVKRLSLTVTTDLRRAPVVGDPGLLERLAGHLVENAVRYNHLQGRIWVRTGSDDPHAPLLGGHNGFRGGHGDRPGPFQPVPPGR